MTTVHEQHTADLAAILASSSGPAVSAVVGTLPPLRLIREPGGMVADSDSGVVQVERETLYLLYTSLGFVPVSNQELTIDGKQWTVESVPWKGAVLQLSVMRYVA